MFFKSKFEKIREAYMLSCESESSSYTGIKKTSFGWVDLVRTEDFPHYAPGDRYQNFLIQKILISKKRGETLVICYAGIYFPE